MSSLIVPLSFNVCTVRACKSIISDMLRRIFKYQSRPRIRSVNVRAIAPSDMCHGREITKELQIACDEFKEQSLTSLGTPQGSKTQLHMCQRHARFLTLGKRESQRHIADHTRSTETGWSCRGKQTLELTISLKR